MKVSKKSVFPISFTRGRFQGNFLSFENENDLQMIYLTSHKASFLCRLLPSCSRIVKNMDFKNSC